MKVNEQCQSICTHPELPSIACIEQAILYIRGTLVILDADLAAFYNIPTKRLNEHVRRNPGRFTDNCLFQLTKDEREKVVANYDHLNKLMFSPHLPYAYTEQGIAAFDSVLKSEKAKQTTLEIMQAFVKAKETSLPETAVSNKRLTDREKEILKYIKNGKRTNDISMTLKICEVTVKFHVSNIMSKLKASSRLHAVIIAESNGLID